LHFALVADRFRVAEYAKAEPLFEQALAIRENPHVATVLNDLARNYEEQGQYTKAEPLYERALAIREKALGLEHTDVVESLNNVARIYFNQGQYAKAEPLCKRALAIDESYGPEHPRVAIGLDHLALLLNAMDRQEDAVPLMRRALEIDEKSYGTEHPEVANRLNKLAQLLQATNRLGEAGPLMRRALVIFMNCTRETGHLHPHLRNAFDNYLAFLEEMSLGDAEIDERLAQVGMDAGFDVQSFSKLAAFQTLLGLGTGRTPTPYELIRGAKDIPKLPEGRPQYVVVC
jgi:tetratricopeptide (TPR) repeat protein